MIFMVKNICVRAPSLPRLATVLVLQRAVNRQPGSRARTRRAGAFSFIFQKIQNLNFSKKSQKWRPREKNHADRTL